MSNVKRRLLRIFEVCVVLGIICYLTILGINHDVLPRYVFQQNSYEDEEWYLSFEAYHLPLTLSRIEFLLKNGEYPSAALLTVCYKPVAEKQIGEMTVEMYLYRITDLDGEELPSCAMKTEGGYFCMPWGGNWQEYMRNSSGNYRLPVPKWKVVYINGDVYKSLEIEMALNKAGD